MKALSKTGFSLLETIIVIGFTAIAGAFFIVILVNSSGLFSTQSSQVFEGLNINDALSKVRMGIKESSAVAGSYTNDGTTYTSGANHLVLKVSSIDSLGNIIENTYDYYVFYLDQDIFRYMVFPDALSARKDENQVLSTKVQSLTFIYLDSNAPPGEVQPTDAKKIKAVLSLRQKAGLGYVVNTATSEASLRND